MFSDRQLKPLKTKHQVFLSFAKIMTLHFAGQMMRKLKAFQAAFPPKSSPLRPFSNYGCELWHLGQLVVCHFINLGEGFMCRHLSCQCSGPQQCRNARKLCCSRRVDCAAEAGASKIPGKNLQCIFARPTHSQL